MKFLPLLVFPLALLSMANAAQILTTNLYITIADGGTIHTTVTAEELSVPGGIGTTIQWGNWYGIGGGEMLIKLEAGEVVTSATILLGQSQLFTLSFEETGIQPQTVLWSGFGPWNPTFSPWAGPASKPVFFQVTTNQGTFGQEFDVIPEPGSAVLAGLGGCLLFSRRRKG